MAILHGSWLVRDNGGYLFIWGETWRSVNTRVDSPPNGIPSHPLAMTQSELISFLRSRSGHSVGESRSISLDKLLETPPPASKGKAGKPPTTKSTASKKTTWMRQVYALPTPSQTTTELTYPAYSGKAHDNSTTNLQLKQWQVEGFCLQAPEAVKFLQALPLAYYKASDAYVGPSLRFWVHVCRWSLDLLARCKFLPGLYQHRDGVVSARWQPLLDSDRDRDRLEKFALLMPSACRTFGKSVTDLPLTQAVEPQELLLGFLSSTIDAQIRSKAGAQSLPASTEPFVLWLRDLCNSNENYYKAEPAAIKRLEAALRAWTMPVQDNIVTLMSQKLGQKLFRTCFSLQPPASGESDWTLKYCLQAVDTPDFLINAETIWNHPVERLVYQDRIIEQPQETFLKGLGLASRLYPIIEPSLYSVHPQFCRLNPVEAYEFIKGSAWRLQDSGLGVVLPPSLRQDWSGRLGLKIQADLPSIKRAGLKSPLKLNVQLGIGDRSLSKQEFERLMAQQSPIVEVNGEWIALQPQDVRAAEKLLKTPPENLKLTVEDALRISSGDNKSIENLSVVNFESSGVLQELIANFRDNQTIEPLVPASFQGKLRPFQARGVGWLAFLQRWGLGACLADSMGLGKTIQTIAFLLHLQETGDLEKPTLLVCPTSVLGNWEREVHKFGPTLKILLHHGDKRLKDKAFAKQIAGKDLVITSYALAYRDAKTLESVSWQNVVLDEAQNIKNPESKQSQAVLKLSAEFRIALTGTPVENRLAELWSILEFLNPGYLGQRKSFQNQFAIPIEKEGDASALQLLRSLVQPFLLRRLKTDREIIQDLPEKQEMNVFCGVSDEQKQLYEKVQNTALDEIENATGIKRRGLIFAMIVKLKQICNHPAHFLKEKELSNPKRSGKMVRLVEMLEEVIESGDRALVFTQFAEWGKLLKPYLEKQLGWETLFLYGGSSKQEREEMIDRFQNDPDGPRIFILSLKAGGIGLNLTRAAHVFHYDRWWNPAVEDQATDRIFRIGQTKNVQVHKFITSGTFEERINEIIESKKELAELTVNAGEEWLTEMDTNQLRSLLLIDRSAIIDEEEA